MICRLDSVQKDLSNLDLAFLIDCTGSMGPHITAARTNLAKIVTGLKEKYHNQINLAFVGYRDKSDGVSILTTI